MSALAPEGHHEAIANGTTHDEQSDTHEYSQEADLAIKATDTLASEDDIPPPAAPPTTDAPTDPIAALDAEDTPGEETSHSTTEETEPQIDKEPAHKDDAQHDDEPSERAIAAPSDDTEDIMAADATHPAQVTSSETPEDSVANREAKPVLSDNAEEKYASDEATTEVGLAVPAAPVDETFDKDVAQEPAQEETKEPEAAHIHATDNTAAPPSDAEERTDIQPAEEAPATPGHETPVVEELDTKTAAVVAGAESSVTETPEAVPGANHEALNVIDEVAPASEDETAQAKPELMEAPTLVEDMPATETTELVTLETREEAPVEEATPVAAAIEEPLAEESAAPAEERDEAADVEALETVTPAQVHQDEDEQASAYVESAAADKVVEVESGNTEEPPCPVHASALVMLNATDETCIAEPDDALDQEPEPTPEDVPAPAVEETQVNQITVQAEEDANVVVAEDTSVSGQAAAEAEVVVAAGVPEVVGSAAESAVSGPEPEVSEPVVVEEVKAEVEVVGISQEPEAAQAVPMSTDKVPTDTPELVHEDTPEAAGSVEAAATPEPLEQVEGEQKEVDDAKTQEPAHDIHHSEVLVEHAETATHSEAPAVDVVDALAAVDNVVAEPEDVPKQEAAVVEDTEVAAASADIATETPSISVTIPSDETESAAVQDEDHPKSPWTPSYTVTTQGADVVVEELAEEITVEVAEAGKEEAIIAPTVPTSEQPAEAHSRAQSWAVSYSVSSQGTSPLQTPQETRDADVEPIENLSASAVDDLIAPPAEFVPKEAVEAVLEDTGSASREQSVDVDDDVFEQVPTPQIVATDEDSHSVEPVIIPDGPEDEPVVQAPAPIEVPERPWTPSYSVSQQGPSPAHTPAEPPAAVEPEATAKQSWTPSYSVSRQGSVSSLKLVDEDKPAPTAEGIAEAKSGEAAVEETDAKASWTPSYSVSRQGSRSSLREANAQVVHEEPATLAEPIAPVITAEPEETTKEEVARPWTPSYSVSRQGSHSSLRDLAAAAALPVATSPIVVEPGLDAKAEIVDSAPTPVTARDTDKAQEQERPQTPSYPVDQQDLPSPVFKEDEVKSVVPVEAESQPEEAPQRPWTPSYSVSKQGTSPAHSPQVVPTELPEPQAEISQLTEQERPWTPSYSVNQQGSSPLLKAAEPAEPTVEPMQITPTIHLEAVANLPEVNAPTLPSVLVVEEPATVESAIAEALAEDVEKPTTQWTPSYSVSRQGSSPKLETAEIAPVEDVAAKDEPPARPWTPSYSVVTQGPVSPGANENGDVFDQQAFPTTEVQDIGPKMATKPSLPRLAPVDEHAPTNVVSPAQLEEPPAVVSPSSGKRARHESNHSSASSRFFPGGWFSGNPKSPEENRPSFDHANGEFTRDSKGNRKAVLAASTEEPEGADAPLNTPVEGVHHHKKKKPRGCVIM